MITFLLCGASWALGMYVGLYISANHNPLSAAAIMERDRKLRIEAEEEFREMVAIRTGKMEADTRYEKWLLECSERKFASRVERMFQSYGQDLRGSEVFVKIMAGAVPFEVQSNLPGSDDYENVEYY